MRSLEEIKEIVAEYDTILGTLTDETWTADLASVFTRKLLSSMGVTVENWVPGNVTDVSLCVTASLEIPSKLNFT